MPKEKVMKPINEKQVPTNVRKKFTRDVGRVLVI